MAAKLIVKQLGGGEVGFVTVDSHGQVHVKCLDLELGAEFQAVIGRLAAAPLARITGGATWSGSATRDRTWAIPVQPGDMGFLEALADAVTRSKETIAGKGLRAWLSEE